jgi:hypothetical protein
MSFADYQALLDRDGAQPITWSPRECVWLMIIARQRGSDELVDRLRAVLRDGECRAPELLGEP